MRFLSSQWLWLLLAIPPLFWIVLFDEKRRRTQFERFAESSVWRTLVPEMDPKARLRKAMAWLAVFGFAVLALARPQWGTHEETVKATGLDILVVLDVSNSMETEDVIPSRLKKARHIIRSLVERLQGDRVGIVAFAASSYVACPLTTDLDYLIETLQILNPHMVTNQGTDIGIGLDTARKALDRGAEETQTGGAESADGSTQHASAPQQASHVVILVSDGEDQEQGAIEAAKILKASGAKLYVLGIGTEKGGPVPIRDDTGSLIGYKKDHSGQPVVSTFHPDALMSVAQAAGGRYFNVTSEELEVEQMLQDMGALNRTEYAERKYLVYEERFQFPLAIAVILAFLEISMPVRRIRKAKGAAAAVVAAFLSLSVQEAHAASLLNAQTPIEAYLENEKGLRAFKNGKPEEAQKRFGTAQALDPDLPELQYNQGVVQMKQGDVDQAIHGFSESSKSALKDGDSDLAAKSLYNLGGALQKKGDIRGAIQAYLSAIQTSGKSKDSAIDGDARKNLELLIQKRQQQKQQEKQDKDKEGKDSKDKQDKDQKDKDQKDKDGKGGQEKKPGDQGKDSSKKDEPKSYADPSKGPKQKFESPKLSKDDAERVMAELSNREKDLQSKIKKQNGTPQQTPNTKDW